MLDEVDDAAGVLVRDRLLACSGRSSCEADLEALVEERHHLEALEQGAGQELEPPRRRSGSGQNVTVVPCAAARACRRRPSSLPCGLPPLANSMRWRLPSRSTSTIEPLGQRVDDRDADAVQAAGDLVALAAELAAGVEHGEHDLGRGLALVLAVVIGSTGMPRPLSTTSQPPSASSVTSMRVQ